MRCSACSKAGLDWMCFCSIEHQKLVSTSQSYLDRLLTSSRQIWPVHKLVCGRHGNPFRWPGFTQAEAEEIISLRYERVLDEEGRRVTLQEAYREPTYKLRKGETFDGLFEVSSTTLTTPTLCSRTDLQLPLWYRPSCSPCVRVSSIVARRRSWQRSSHSLCRAFVKGSASYERNSVEQKLSKLRTEASTRPSSTSWLLSRYRRCRI